MVVSISNLPMLQKLEINGCKEVVVRSCVDLWSVKEITLSNISKFACITNEMMMSESMKVEYLNLDGWEELDSFWWSCLVPLTSLRALKLENCPKVASLGATKEEKKAELQQFDIPCDIEVLRIHDYKGLEKLSKTLHSNLTCLREIYIAKCPKLVSIVADNLPSTLKSLDIWGCEDLVCLLDDGENINFSTISLLESLQVQQCKALKLLSSSGMLPLGLKMLEICMCLELEFVAQKLEIILVLNLLKSGLVKISQGLDKLSRPQRVEVSNCENLVCFPESGLPITNLKSVWIEWCGKLEALPKLHSLLQLQELCVEDCPRVRPVLEGDLPTNLTSLTIFEPNISKAVIEWGIDVESNNYSLV